MDHRSKKHPKTYDEGISDEGKEVLQWCLLHKGQIIRIIKPIKRNVGDTSGTFPRAHKENQKVT